MVSLGRNFDTSAGGGVSFNDGSQNLDDPHLQPILGPEDLPQFRPLRTIAAVAFELAVAIGVFAVSVVFAAIWTDTRDKCEPYYILYYAHAIYWCISLVVHHHVKSKHHVLRMSGYLEFYEQTYTTSRMPFYVASLWNVVLLLVNTIFQHVYQDLEKKCKAPGVFKPVNYLCVVFGLEILALSSFIGTYISKVSWFNSSKPLPDILKDEWSTSYSQDHYNRGEIGYREQGDHVQDILEKQADLIRYLKEHNRRLAHRLMVLNEPLPGQA